MRVSAPRQAGENQPVTADHRATTDVERALAASLQLLAGGDRDALQQIWDLVAVDLYGFALWATGSPADADDVVQETFVRLVRFARDVARAERPKAYLLTMARRVAIDLRRRHGRAEPLESAPLLIGCDAAPEQALDAQRASALVQRLSPKQREAVYLRHFAELTFEEIGRVLGVPAFTVASRYRLALRQLRQWMGVSP
jgi:RNA polymerase sigma-70 factor (ECF subfamily)